jgi:hypothetical protein
LIRWKNVIYGKQQPPHDIGGHKFPSQERAQQGDPAAMQLFSLAIELLPRKISKNCDMKFNMFARMTVTLAVAFWKSTKLVDTLRDEGPLVQ